MNKDYNYNYENRVTAKSKGSAVSLSNLECASCKSADLKKNAVSNGRLWHTTDTNEFFYDWNGKRNKLNLTGDSASLSAEIAKIKSDLAKIDVNKINQAVTKATQATTAANNAAALAREASTAAQEAAAQVNDKVDETTLNTAIDEVKGMINNISLTPGPQGEPGRDGVDGKDGQDGAQGPQGESGRDGVDGKDGAPGTPGADGKDGKDGVDGQDGITPHIGANGNWFLGDVDTNVKAAGVDGQNGQDGQDGTDGKDGKDGQDGQNGQDGVTPHIGQNGNWFIGDEDTNVPASGQGGLTPEDRAKIDSIPDDLTQGAFPDDSDPEGSDFTPGLATVQDVIDYVNALIEKKKDELGPADDKEYFYVNGVEAAVLPNLVVPDSPTSIYQMNPVEITDSILENGYEVYISPEANGYYAPDSPVDTIYSEVFSVYVPTGYTLKVYCYDEDTDDKWSAVEEPMVVHPKHATIQYGGKTYNCYARRSLSSADDEYAGIGEYSPYSGAYSVPTRYKIELSK